MTLRVGQVRAFNAEHAKRYSDQGGSVCVAVRVVTLNARPERRGTREIILEVARTHERGIAKGYSLGRRWAVPASATDWLLEYTDPDDSLFRRPSK